MIVTERRASRRRATTMVEMTFIALLCFTFMFAIFEYGRYVQARQVMENAGRAGGRAAVVTATSYILPATATANVDAVITSALANTPLVNVVIQLYQADNAGNNIGAWTSTPFGRNIVVQIDADLPLIFPTFGFLQSNGGATNSIHITTKCMMRGEAN
jgi:Flp pilus assembly protein TadG